MWRLGIGQDEEYVALLEHAKRSGRRAKSLDARTELDPAWSGFWDVFNACCAGRQWIGGMEIAPNPISASDIAVVLDLHGIHDEEERSMQFRMIRTLDKVWLREHGKRRQKRG
jgi:hypothetical protein